jgi:superfamily II DNA or RNA helicase
MEKLQLVRARGARWRVADVDRFDDCTLVTLHGADVATVGETRRLLLPFDDLDPIVQVERARHVPLRRWRRACRALIASAAPPGALRSAASARIDLLPHQLEPALAVLRGLGCRLLLADDVGLGKTIQAALVVSELLARKAVERVLVLTPSGLRTQWTTELSDRFGVAAFLADARSLRQLTATLPAGMNPWTAEPVAVASVDYVKRAEVLPAVQSCRWDIVIVDEAHTVAGDSNRRTAVEAIAARASYVILLSATPHNGDESAFAALCAIGSCGAPDDPLLIFRRTRESIRPQAVRAVRVLHVRPSRQERRVFALLAQYERAVRDEHGPRALALSVLRKRAYSTPWALAESVDRRLASIIESGGGALQLQLPLLDGAGEFDTEDEPPPWPPDLALADIEKERRLLTALSNAAREASRGAESKLGALGRLLRRARESALVFTEFRDTAAHVQTALGRGLLLHGGLTALERQRVLAAFESRPCEVLIATDAAGQGLNLQRACRLVVDLELPWNPMRLEQRIGRVDRIGQSRRVHAVHLVGHFTGEAGILRRLEERLERARAAIGAPDPIRGSRIASTASTELDLSQGREASEEAERLAQCRMLERQGDRDALNLVALAPWWTARGRRAVRMQIGRRTLCVYRVSVESALSTTIASRVAALLGPYTAITGIGVAQLIEPALAPWLSAVRNAEAAVADRRLGRERAILLTAAPHNPMFQPALFDRRAERDSTQRAEERAELFAALDRRLSHVERQAALAGPEIRLLLVLLP